MPIYVFECANGHRFEELMTVKQFEEWTDGPIFCVPTHGSNLEPCGEVVHPIITAPLFVKAAPDVSYDSPIDGRPITSMQARQEDLKRSGCVAYDPDQKTELDRKVKQDEAALDRDIEATVEEAVTKMDGDARRRLASELLEQGMTADTVRTTPHA